MTTYYAIIHKNGEGPAYGIGKTESGARADAASYGFGDSGVVVEITAQSFRDILGGNPDAVELANSDGRES